MKKIYIEKEIIQATVCSGKTKRQICNELGICVDTYNRLLLEYNIEFKLSNRTKCQRPVHNYLFVDKEWLIDNWQNTSKSLSTLSKEFNIPESLLESRCRKYDIHKKYKYYVNRDVLYNSSDPNICYIAGLIATDGYLDHKHNAMCIQLVGDSEHELLSDICNYLQSNSNVVDYTDRCGIRIADDYLVDFFKEKFNIPSQDKTFNLKTPDSFANEDCAKAYFLGCVDGDGYIRKDKFVFKLLTASQPFIYGLQNIAQDYANIHLSVGIAHPRVNTSYHYVYCNGNTCKEFLSWVYSTTASLRLSRKYNIFKELMI